MKTIITLTVSLMVAGFLLIAFVSAFWMDIIGVILIIAGIFLLFSYILGDRASNGLSRINGVTKAPKIHTNTAAELDLLRQDIRMVTDVQEKIQLISRCHISDCAMAAQDMLNEDLEEEERYRNAHLLIDRGIMTRQDIQNFKKQMKKAGS